VLGFLGIRDVTFVRAEGLAFSPQHRESALSAAHEAIPGAGRARGLASADG
jgi:FMN-dependent NADH-azoreductase